MGTNFYVRLNYCEHCGRYETLHIGKRSCGWKFDFAYDNFKSINEVREKLKNQTIVDEYARTYTYEEFMKMVEELQSGKTHADGTYACFINIDGYDFAIGEFS